MLEKRKERSSTASGAEAVQVGGGTVGGARDAKAKPKNGNADATVWRVRSCRAVEELMWACCAFVLGQGQLAFGTYPLGLALLCAVPRHTLSVLAGLIFSSATLLQSPIVYVCTYVAAALVRVAASLILDSPEVGMDLPQSVKSKLKKESENAKKTEDDRTCEQAVSEERREESRLMRLRNRLREKGETQKLAAFAEAFLGIFSERVCLRMATAAVCGLIVGLTRVITGGFVYYDLFAAIFTVLTVPAAVAVWSVFSEGKPTHPFLLRVSQGSLLFSLVWSAKTLLLVAVPLSPILALFFTLAVTAKRGFVLGAGTALLCGVAYMPIHAPAFLLAALVSFLTKGEKREGGVLLACLSMLAWAVYAGGAEGLLSLLPAALIAGTSFRLLCKLFPTELLEEEKTDAGQTEAPQKEADDGDDGEAVRQRLEVGRHREANDRFRGISDAFSSLSEMFYNLSDRFRRPGTLDLRRICDRSFDAFCPNCPNKGLCWGAEYAVTLDTVNALTSALHTKGRVSRAEIPAAMAHRCDTVDAILETVNRECAKLTGELLQNNRTEIFAMDYESAAKIINDALEEDDGEYRFDPEQEQKIFEYLTDAGVRAQSVTVYGKRRRQIVVRGVDVEEARVTVETLCSDLGEMCGIRLGSPTFEVEGNVSTMILRAKKKIAVMGAKCNIAADGGVSGDSVNLFSNKKDYFYALISDGMGAGREAALTSNLCSVFLEKMLRAGNRASTSIRMLNNMIRSRCADSTLECSSTVDLLELDLMSAEASFIKSGAAPGFVIRGRVVHRIHAGSYPIGIISIPDMNATPFPLRVGDTVVMISDGILQGDPDAAALCVYLSSAALQSPEEIVYHICRNAARAEGHDDCSAIALRITEAE